MLPRLLRDLAPFDPTVVGTFPLGLQIDGSDLDIACTCSDLDAFERALRASLATAAPGATPPARIERLELSPEAMVAALAWDGLPIEIFCQPLPVHEQAGFRHMIVEGRLLALGGAPLRDRVRALKLAGTKTEPAFAQVLGLDGDPYATLLTLEDWPTPRLLGLVLASRATDPTAPPPP